MRELSDRALARRCAELEEDAWRELLRRHEARIARALWRALPRSLRGHVEDLRQDVYLKLLAHGRAALCRVRAERPGALAAFLSRVARRVALDHLSSRATARTAPDDLIAEALLARLAVADPDAALERRWRRGLLAEVLQSVAQGSTADRDLLILRAHFLEGQSAADIARMPFGLASDGVEALLRRSRARIAERLRGEPADEGSLSPAGRAGAA